MNNRHVVARSAGMILMLGAMLGSGERLQAHDQSREQTAKALARRIEGVWLPMVTITDCQTHAVLATFPSMDLYVRGGGFVGFGAARQSDQIGFGAWHYVGDRRYSVEYQFFNYVPSGAPDGTPDGTLLRVSAALRLNAAGTAFTSSETADVVDAAGNILTRVCGARAARRLQ